MLFISCSCCIGGAAVAGAGHAVIKFEATLGKMLSNNGLRALMISLFIGLALSILITFIFVLKDRIEVRKRNRKIDRYNAKAYRKNRANIKVVEKRNDLLIAESNIMKENLEKTNKILDHAYVMNIIYEKYRHNLVYTCSIFE